jgi:hypothetical protein
VGSVILIMQKAKQDASENQSKTPLSKTQELFLPDTSGAITPLLKDF